MSEADYIDLSNPISNFIASKAHSLTKGRRGKIFTEAMILADIAQNDDRLRVIYDANKSVLNEYFDEVDFNKLADRIGKDNIIKATNKTALGIIQQNWIPFTVGAVVGIGLIALAKRKK